MSEQNARKVKKDINIKVIISIVAVLVIFGICGGLLACNYMNTSANNIIDDNVYINNIYVGGLTVDEATAKIEKAVDAEYFNKDVDISYGGKTYSFNVRSYVTLDAKQTATDALEVRAKGEKKVLPFKFVLNDDAKKDLIRYALSVEERSGFLTFEDDYAVANIDASKLTEILDVDKTLELVAKNAGNNKFENIEGLVIKRDAEGFADALYTRISREPVNASVEMNDDKSTYVVAEVVGITADKDKFMSLYKAQNGVFSMPVKATLPELTTKDLDIDFYQDVLGTYTSKYDVNLVNRTKNVTLAAQLVNGTVIMPGQTFSYNRVVGPRTAERGFKQATVYTGEGTEEGLGGGICQVSSTIYCAQLRANLKTVSRTNHSYTVVYVPLGQDATVSYGSLDYVFENDTNYPIKIETSIGGGSLTVRILGTKVDKSLTYDVVSVTNSTTGKKEVQKEDPTLPAGETQVKQNGQNGAVVSTYKIYYKDGVEIKREFIGKSTYVAMNKIVLVGTGEPVEGTEDGVTPEDGETVDPETDVTLPENEETSSDTDSDTDSGTESDTTVNEIETSDTGL